MLRQFRLQQRTELTETTKVLQWLEVTLKPLIPEKVYWQCQVALIEAFTNIVRHAHYNLPSHTPIEIQINLYIHYLEMCVWDWGEPFDLIKYLQSLGPIQSQSLEKEEGRGLYLIHELMDEVEHTRLSQGRNCLVMRKLIEREINPKNH
ncbi:ATP-binding protein [Gloeocapsa sp. PCC 73106]|uniref:ATP-binding protein n=1 Tax=Gloeocapsa sp. PCC 73106 TaxID=102232 RepID=UPI0019309D1D|nr:ATP-binding protein [Gloeocapsa sp. PCC 73106]